MSESFRIHKRKLVVGFIIVLLFVGFKWSQTKKTTDTPLVAKTDTTQVTERKASVVSFGDWSPNEYRTVLGQVLSDSDVKVQAELNGTIARINVQVGDKVTAGQALASYKTSGDPTAINYQSALNSLQTTKLSSQNSVRSSEITVENAQKSLAQTITQQDQSTKQAYESLRVETLNADSLIGASANKIDEFVFFTNKHFFNQPYNHSQIGNNDTIRKQRVKTLGRNIANQFLTLVGLSATSSEAAIIEQANVRRKLVEDLQVACGELGWLLRRGTVPNTRITELEIDGFIAEVDGLTASLNTTLNALQTKIDTAQGSVENNRLAIVNAKNALESAQSNLELAKAQAEANIIGAQNQVNLAGASTADLTVRAAISGTITAKNINVGALVNPGTELFTIVNESESKKVVSYLSQDEWREVQKAQKITIEIDGKVLETSEFFLSSQLDVNTQKVLAEFTIPAKTTLVGNLATVRIPVGSDTETEKALLPFSAVSFEPDGAEVLLVDQAGLAQRQKVIVDRVVVSNIEIVSGLKKGDLVVEFYKRVFPGEKVINDQVAAREQVFKVNEKAKNMTSKDVLNKAAELELNLGDHE